MYISYSGSFTDGTGKELDSMVEGSGVSMKPEVIDLLKPQNL